jgi:tetratricopeptide (TPR) repeat protein
VFIIPLILDSFFEGEFSDRPQQVLKGGLLGLSVLFCVTPVLTYPFAPPEFTFPHNDLWFAFLWRESWFAPNLANVIGAPSAFLGVLPVVQAVAAALALVAFKMPKPRNFAAGIAVGAALFGVYILLPGLEDAEGLRFRRAAIAERYFRPAGRIEPYLTDAAARRDVDALRRINDFQWTIAEARAYAPDDFPYLEPEPLSESPRMMQEKAASLMKQGRTAETEALLRKGAEQWPFAACELRTNLAVVYYTTARKDAAMRELELVEPLVTPASRADCLRSQFLLGSLYRETGRADDARRLFNLFVTNSSSSADPEIIRLRNQLIAN